MDSVVLTRTYEISHLNKPNITKKTETTDMSTNCMNAKMRKTYTTAVENLEKRKTCQDELISINKKAAILDDFTLRWTQKQLLTFLDQHSISFFVVSISILIFLLMIFSIYVDLFSNVFVIFVVSFQVALTVSILCAWIGVYIVYNFSNALNDCDIFEKTMNICNIKNYNDVTVSIKVQNFRSRYAKHVYYNCTRVVYECHSFQSLISQQYTSFILIVGCIGVDIIYCPDSGDFKIFDSRAKNIYGNSHPQLHISTFC